MSRRSSRIRRPSAYRLTSFEPLESRLPLSGTSPACGWGVETADGETVVNGDLNVPREPLQGEPSGSACSGAHPAAPRDANALIVMRGPDQVAMARHWLQVSSDLFGGWFDNVAMRWSQVSGPGNALFTNSQSAATAVQFDEPGEYELQLTTDADGLRATGTVAVAVTPNDTQANLPELPREFIDTTYSLPVGGQTWVVNEGDSLQAALDGAQQGDVIILQAGATFSGNFVLPKKEGEGWIYVISSQLDQLPEGTRVGLDQAHLMPRLVAANNSLPVIVSLFGTHHVRFAGIEVVTDQPKTDLIRTGYGIPDGSNSIWDLTPAESVDQLPRHLVFDRMLIHSTSDVNRLRVGIALNGQHMSVIDSHIANIKDTADAQAILSFNGDGPYKISNNFLEATGENVLFGGNDPKILNLVPSDIEIRGNYFFKRLSWLDPDLWSIKNILELKNAQRLLIAGNVFENNWADAQRGSAILLSPRNQNGGGSWTVVQDVSFENNLIRNVGQAIRIHGEDGNYASEQTKRIHIYNNVVENVNSIYGVPRLMWIVSPGTAGTGAPGRPVLDLTVRHNTMLYNFSNGHVGNNWLYLESTGQIVVENLVVQDNVLAHGDYGPNANYSNNAGYSGNVFIFDANERTYSNFVNNFSSIYPGNSKADRISDVGFIDYLNGDYRLAENSPHKNTATDASDPGVNFGIFYSAIASALTSVPGLMPSPASEIGDLRGASHRIGEDVGVAFVSLEGSSNRGPTPAEAASVSTSQSIEMTDQAVAEYDSWLATSVGDVDATASTFSMLDLLDRESRMDAAKTEWESLFWMAAQPQEGLELRSEAKDDFLR